MVHARAIGLAILGVVLAGSGLACGSSTLDGSGTAGRGGGGSGGSAGAAGSAGQTYSLRFVCDSGSRNEGCPPSQTCPEVPLSAAACGDLPSVGDHAAIPATVGRPVSCVAMLPYENPWYAGQQQQCTCFEKSPLTGTVGWVCAL